MSYIEDKTMQTGALLQHCTKELPAVKVELGLESHPLA